MEALAELSSQDAKQAGGDDAQAVLPFGIRTKQDKLKRIRRKLPQAAFFSASNDPETPPPDEIELFPLSPSPARHGKDKEKESLLQTR